MATKQKENSCPVLSELHDMIDILYGEVCKKCIECSTDNPNCALRHVLDGMGNIYNVNFVEEE